MTRLEQTRRKKYYSQLGLFVFLFILIIIFFATIGIKLLVTASLFVADLQHKPKLTEDYGNLLVPPDISDVPDATNSARLVISGHAAAEKNLNVFVNDEKQKDVITDENGFSTEITLHEGENSVYVELIDNEKNAKKTSPVYKVIYRNQKPKLDITSPNDQQIINKDSIDVMGMTDQGVTIKINGNPVVLSADSSFSQNIMLTEGDNTIHIEAQDDAGNSEIKDIVVTYRRD